MEITHIAKGNEVETASYTQGHVDKKAFRQKFEDEFEVDFSKVEVVHGYLRVKAGKGYFFVFNGDAIEGDEEVTFMEY